MQQLDFTADLTFRNSEQGGRMDAVASGYRPHIEFDYYPEYLTSGMQQYLNKDTVFPGDSVKAAIRIAGTNYFANRLYIGKPFKFCEGERTIGIGVITKITNKALEVNPNDKEEEFNLNLYPEDILDRLKNDFGGNADKAIRTIQPFLISSTHYRNPRIVRALIHLSLGNITELQKQINVAQVDWRDLLYAAEYVDRHLLKPSRVRDFNNAFGKESL